MAGYWDSLCERHGIDDSGREKDRTMGPWAGDQSEQYAAERWGWTVYETGYSDLLVPHDDPEREMTEQYPGSRRRIQVKAARLRIADESSSRRGRFRVWRRDQKKLIECDGPTARYLFLGYHEDASPPVQCVRFVEAPDLTDLVDDWSWWDGGHRKGGVFRQITTADVFPGISD
jgi:hypothetical protein